MRGVDRLAATLAAGRDVADRFKVLATLRTDADVGTVDDWEWTGPTPEFAAWCERFGAPRLAARVDEAGAETEELAIDERRGDSSSRCGRASRRSRLNRPERLNAMNYDLVAGLLRRARRAAPTTARCRVIVLTGAGRGFCAGLDLTEGASPPATRGAGPRAGRA